MPLCLHVCFLFIHSLFILHIGIKKHTALLLLSKQHSLLWLLANIFVTTILHKTVHMHAHANAHSVEDKSALGSGQAG